MRMVSRHGYEVTAFKRPRQKLTIYQGLHGRLQNKTMKITTTVSAILGLAFPSFIYWMEAQPIPMERSADLLNFLMASVVISMGSAYAARCWKKS